MNSQTFLSALATLSSLPEAYRKRAQELSRQLDDVERQQLFLHLRTADEKLQQANVHEEQILTELQQCVTEWTRHFHRGEQKTREKASSDADEVTLEKLEDEFFTSNP